MTAMDEPSEDGVGRMSRCEPSSSSGGHDCTSGSNHKQRERASRDDAEEYRSALDFLHDFHRFRLFHRAGPLEVILEEAAGPRTPPPQHRHVRAAAAWRCRCGTGCGDEEEEENEQQDADPRRRRASPMRPSWSPALPRTRTALSLVDLVGAADKPQRSAPSPELQGSDQNSAATDEEERDGTSTRRGSSGADEWGFFGGDDDDHEPETIAVAAAGGGAASRRGSGQLVLLDAHRAAAYRGSGRRRGRRRNLRWDAPY